MVDLDRYSVEQLKTMLDAGWEVLECHAVLAKTGDNIVGELLPDEGQFFEFNHCPAGDIFDAGTHSQFYYHAHREGEHGHFHVFMREGGMPKDCRPIKQSKTEGMEKHGDKTCHLVAISMDHNGIPTRLFTTNRWVTAENWYRWKDVCAMIDRFKIEHAKPSWPVNLWMTAMLKLFRPQIEQVLRERDSVLAKWKKEHPNEDVFELRDLGIPSMIEISIDEQVNALQAALDARHKEQAA